MTRFLRPWHVLTLALAVGAAALVPALGGHDHSTVAASARTNRAAFHDGMRQLWEDHIVWTREFIVSFAAGAPDLPAVTDRLSDALLADLGPTGLIELAARVAFMNMTARMNLALGIHSEGFADACGLPPLAQRRAASDRA